MSRVRFATVRALFETFPEVAKQIGAAPTDQTPTEFLRGLASKGKLDEAVTVCAYLLPRREAVWWACGCARALLDEIPPDRWEGLLAAESWVQTPDDEHRTAALDIANKSDRNHPLTWLAFAAGWSSGSLVAFPEVKAPVPPYMTARTARIAILLSAAKLGKVEREIRLRSCIAEGIKIAETGLG
jgi:Family of unknown function (DUF6931)